MNGVIPIFIILYVVGLFILYGIITAAVTKGIENSEIITKLDFHVEQNGKIIHLLSEIKKNQEKQ